MYFFIWVNQSNHVFFLFFFSFLLLRSISIYFVSPLCVTRKVRDLIVCASTRSQTFKVRWWNSATTVSQCRIVSAARTSIPATSSTATGPCTSTPTTTAASTSWDLESTPSSLTGGPPAPPLGPSAELQIFRFIVPFTERWRLFILCLFLKYEWNWEPKGLFIWLWSPTSTSMTQLVMTNKLISRERLFLGECVFIKQHRCLNWLILLIRTFDNYQHQFLLPHENLQTHTTMTINYANTATVY